MSKATKLADCTPTLLRASMNQWTNPMHPCSLRHAAETHVNAKHSAELKEQMTAALKERLAGSFAPHNQWLDEFLGYATGYRTTRVV